MTDESPALTALRARVDRLERQNRRLKGGVLLLAVGAGAALLLRGGSAEAQPGGTLPALEAQSLKIRDAAGRVRVAMSPIQGGSVALALYHPNGAMAVNLFTGQDGSSNLHLLDGRRIVRLGLAVARDGASNVSFFDPAGKAQRIGLGATKDGAGVTVLDGAGKARVRTGVGSDGTPYLVLLDAAGNQTWAAK